MVCGAMFAQIEANCARGKQMADATNVSLVILVILALAALVGTRLLDLFGVSLDAFMVAGGGVLAWMGSLEQGEDESNEYCPALRQARGVGHIL